MRIDDTTGGNAGVEPRLAVMYTQMVAKRGWSLERFVDLTSTSAAKIMGLHPRKSMIAVGADADLTVLDPGAARTVRKKNLHESDYRPREGQEVAVWPTATVAHAVVVCEDGAFHGGLDRGRFLARQVPAAIRSGPAL